MKKGTKKGGNASQAIRDYAAANPGLGTTQIAKDLVAQGIKAYPALVSQALRGVGGVKSKAKKTAKKGAAPKAKAGRGRPASQGKEVDSFSQLKAAADFVKVCGGADQAIDAIKTLQKISAYLA